MNWIRYIVRFVFFLWIVILLIDLNRRTEGHTKTIAEFKFETLKQVQADSLGTRHQMAVVLKETAKFIDESPQVRNGIRDIVMLLFLLIIIEVIFLVVTRRNSGPQPGA